jgi:pimeloyl-ACP methyl ester carboxylesterase
VRAEAGGVGIEFDVTGPDGGRPVILLHGFPDAARLWRRQVSGLADAGFRVIAPDLRGFGRSDKPEGVGAYNLLLLAGDVMAVLDAAGAPRAHVVGHDGRVDHLVALSVGHPTAFRGAGLPQQVRSWYMLLFQFPGVAERWLADDGWANLREWSHHPDVDGVIADLEADGSLTPGLSWYRANIPPESWVGPPLELPPVQAPAMGVWSTGDFALTEAQMTGSAPFCANGFRYERLAGAGHWMQLEAPDQVTGLLLDFLPR